MVILIAFTILHKNLCVHREETRRTSKRHECMYIAHFVKWCVTRQWVMWGRLFEILKGFVYESKVFGIWTLSYRHQGTSTEVNTQ